MSNFLEADDNYKFALSKRIRDEIFKLLIQPDNFDSLTGFIKDVDFLFRVDLESNSVRTSDKQQHGVLVEILKKTNALIELLQKISFDDLTKIDAANLQTVILIQYSFIAIRTQNESEIATKNDALCLPINYPTALTDSLFEMRDAVAHAAKEVKLKRGNSINQKPETLRKRFLAGLFVKFYYDRFNKLPPITEKSPANQVFNILLSATGMQRNFELHTLRYAIERHKGMPQEKRVKKSTEYVKDKT